MTSIERISFQSYQFRQINPDYYGFRYINCKWKGFNRINSGRSIPTLRGSNLIVPCHSTFQSYQFRQINPDKWFLISLKILGSVVSIVSIQADQSRLCSYWRCSLFNGTFQSYQFRQINPDRDITGMKSCGVFKFQSYQFRQINPDYRTA